MTPTITLVEAKATDQRYQGTADVLTTVRSGVASAGAGRAGVLRGVFTWSVEVCDDAYLQIYRPKSEVANASSVRLGTNRARLRPDRQLWPLRIFCKGVCRDLTRTHPDDKWIL